MRPRSLLLQSLGGAGLLLLSLTPAQAQPVRMALLYGSFEAVPPSPSWHLSVPVQPSPRASMPRPAGLSQRAWLEMSAVTLTGLVHLGFSAMDASAYFIPLVGLGWGSYVYSRARAEPGYLREAGFTGRNLGPAFRDVGLVALASTALMAGIGYRQGSLRMEPGMAPLFALYPLWGWTQQFLVQRMLAANLTEARGTWGSPYVVAPVAALAFGATHVPNWRLAAATTAMGLAFTPLYLKHRNLWPIGLAHGVLGVLFYYWVLDRDPWDSL